VRCWPSSQPSLGSACRPQGWPHHRCLRTQRGGAAAAAAPLPPSPHPSPLLHTHPLLCSAAPALSAILEQASPIPSHEAQEGEGQEGGEVELQERRQQGGASPPLAAAAGGAQGTPPGGAALGRSPFQRSLSPPRQRGSPAASSPASSAAATPTAAARGLPLPGGVPRIVLQGFPAAALQPQPDSNDWMHYAESVSESGPSAAEGRDSDLRSTQRTQREATPGSDGGTPHSGPPRRAAAPPMPLPAGGGSVDVSALLDARSGRRSLSPPPGVAARGLASAPASARSPFAAVVGGGAAAASAVHRLANAAGPASGRVPHRGASAAEDDSPRAAPAAAASRGLGRTSSAPAGQLAAAAAAGCPPGEPQQRRRLVSAQHYRGRSMALGREAAAASLASPEAAAVAGRANSRLARRVTDQLVQVGPGPFQCFLTFACAVGWERGDPGPQRQLSNALTRVSSKLNCGENPLPLLYCLGAVHPHPSVGCRTVPPSPGHPFAARYQLVPTRRSLYRCTAGPGEAGALPHGGGHRGVAFRPLAAHAHAGAGCAAAAAQRGGSCRAAAPPGPPHLLPGRGRRRRCHPRRRRRGGSRCGGGGAGAAAAAPGCGGARGGGEPPGGATPRGGAAVLRHHRLPAGGLGGGGWVVGVAWGRPRR
jgi:hypothetical protein